MNYMYRFKYIPRGFELTFNVKLFSLMMLHVEQKYFNYQMEHFTLKS